MPPETVPLSGFDQSTAAWKVFRGRKTPSAPATLPAPSPLPLPWRLCSSTCWNPSFLLAFLQLLRFLRRPQGGQICIKVFCPDEMPASTLPAYVALAAPSLRLPQNRKAYRYEP